MCGRPLRAGGSLRPPSPSPSAPPPRLPASRNLWHPQFNASLDPAAGELVLKRYYHLGVAVATDRGLIVPVIRDVDRKPLPELQRELAALAQRVREGKATLEDLRGGTFTLTNIGALGGTGAVPIINYPEVAILGVARAREEPVVLEGDRKSTRL